MSHPVFWESKWFFYPIGNTSPVCLTEYLPPELDAAILLLGCGDARNVLYTIYASGHDGRADRKLDFTCCDWEPAILARNVVLYTLLMDHDLDDIYHQLWNIYYHFMIDDASLTLLSSHSTKLAGVAEDIETWNTSPYANIVRICNRYTLSELRRLWSLYADVLKWSGARRKTFKRDFQDTLKKTAKENPHVMTAMRNAGPFALFSANDVSDLHSQFWKTGALTGNLDTTHVNPTFAFASQLEGFVAHYGTCPITAFPLAPAYASLNRPKSVSPHGLTKTIQAQFRAWCRAFCTSARETKNVVIRVVVGDILSTCRTLRHLSDFPGAEISANIPVKAWNASPLVFDGGDYASKATGMTAPLLFDVVDTSNLSDHTGMLNVLLATVPLLKRTPFATINTETLLAMGKDPTRSFSERLCGDITTISVLLGVLPISFISGFATQSNVHELLGHASNGNPTRLESRQFHERLVWKLSSLSRTSSAGHITINSLHLARFLFSVYLKMFSYEDTMSMFRNMGDLTDILEKSTVHYSRESFAIFISLLKEKVETNWSQVVDTLLSMISSDRQLMMGLNHYQDLLCHLHSLNIHSALVFHLDDSALLKNYRVGRLRGWTLVPPTIYIVLQVPRSKMQCLDDEDMPKTPVLNAELVSMSANFHNAFTSLSVLFGTATQEGTGEESQVYLTEDPRGKHGKSSVVVVFRVPTWLLAVAPEQTSVTLGVKSTPIHSTFSQKLGLTMTIHSAPLMDTESVFVVRFLPTLQPTSKISSAGPRGSTKKTTNTAAVAPSARFDDSCSVLQTMTVHEDLVDDAGLELAKPSTKVESRPDGPCEVDVQIGSKFVRHLQYPYPVDVHKANLRIARKSGWIEMVVPLCGAAALRPNKFLIPSDGLSFAPWNIHRIFLDRMPVVDNDNTAKDFGWAVTHTTLMLSDKERAMAAAGNNKDIPTIVHVKQSILAIFHNIIKPARENGSRVFGLHKVSGGGLGTIIFVENLRLDLASHTIVADGYVLPLSDSFVAQFINKLGELEQAGGITHLACQDEELTEWAQLIPSLVERCRDWSHKTDCAYVREGAIPLATGFGDVPICDCGRGKVSSTFAKHKSWAPFAPHVTRIAISPLFTVSYLDTVIGDIDSKFTKMKLDGGATSSDGSQNPRTESTQCTYCKRLIPSGEKLMRCSRCKQVVYCGGTCQSNDWPTHKKICVKT
ncbi:hypothetical protein BDY19DRAFT_888350 [Irpex rosettiformis]|uniref:Uncharacterized protein n=1 Tax=Irpex rosettiformis TaxID=378272 RepID=A0ACB8U8F2_9APHY|nr:hypothetical protein BDY19DRAFT_888350 [Irpex rosettiformis]